MDTTSTVLFLIFIVTPLVLLGIGFKKSMEKEKRKQKELEEKRLRELQEQEEARQRELQNLLNALDYVKVLGTRSAVNTVIGFTRTDVNSTLYSLLLVFKDGTQQTREVDQDEIGVFANFIRT
ncbi:MAG: hypothetical protein K5663_07935 [Clostridiales bacterium]|nr:hypothetical protein [Clostridiales bacterium]